MLILLLLLLLLLLILVFVFVLLLEFIVLVVVGVLLLDGELLLGDVADELAIDEEDVDGWLIAGVEVVAAVVEPVLRSLKSNPSLEDAKLDADVVGLKTTVPLPSAISLVSLGRLEIILLLLSNWFDDGLCRAAWIGPVVLDGCGDPWSEEELRR